MENPLITREAVDQSRATINMAARANAPSTSAMSRTYQRWVGTARGVGNRKWLKSRNSEIGNRRKKRRKSVNRNPDPPLQLIKEQKDVPKKNWVIED